MIDLPDFGTPLRSIAGSVEKIAGTVRDTGAVVEHESRPSSTSLPAETAEKSASVAKEAIGSHV
jgi:hypothetical protein